MQYGPRELAAIHARLERGDVAGALAAIDEAVASEPANASAWHLAGVVRRRAGQPGEAADALEQAIARGMATAELYNSLGLARQDAGHRDAALAAYDEAVARDPLYEPAQVNRARLMVEMGRWRAGEAALRAVIAANPGSALARNALANTLRESHRSMEAADEFRAVLERDPANRVAAIRIGQALCDIGETTAAVEHYNALAARFAASSEFTESQAAALRAAGQIEGARSRLESLVRQAPAHFSAHRALARLAREHGGTDDPYRSYRELVRQWPGEESIWLDWAALLLSFREFDAVLDLVPQAKGHIGRRPALTMFEAIALGELDRPVEAEAKFEELAGDFGTRHDFLNARTRNALRLEEAGRAEQYATQVTRADPQDQFGWAYLSLAWRLQGDPREFWLHDYEIQARQLPLPHLADSAALGELADTLRAIHTAVSHPPDQTLRGGTQTTGSLLTRQEPAIRTLRDAILARLAEYASGLPADREHPFYSRKNTDLIIRGSWSVRLQSDGFHVMHLHEQGWVSSALHLVVPVRDEEDVSRGALVLGAPPTELGLDLEPRRVVQPEVGSLVLFPSSMWHGTMPFRTSAERLTVAFDAVPAG